MVEAATYICGVVSVLCFCLGFVLGRLSAIEGR